MMRTTLPIPVLLATIFVLGFALLTEGQGFVLGRVLRRQTQLANTLLQNRVPFDRTPAEKQSFFQTLTDGTKVVCTQARRRLQQQTVSSNLTVGLVLWRIPLILSVKLATTASTPGRRCMICTL
ncbi:hypothetical protein R1flu_024970 [Riccia fluitans]|uniref:ATP synthase protein MI25 n=1 Tax=Riccia fluitans TaxID=41844 RepID=A0ABD1XXC1_9MARC